MKKLLCLLLLAVSAATVADADIQAPPMSNQGPTRKLGRGISNFLLGISEVQQCASVANDTEGNMALPAGFIRGVGRAATRGAVGFYEIVTFPFPTKNGTYKPALRSDIPWIHSGYEEFPPELGWESRYNYIRN